MADDDKGGGVTLDQVRALITDALKGTPKSAPADAAGDVASQVEAAVARVHQGQAADAERQALQARIEALESRAPEKKPREFRAITRRIWGHDDDE